MNNNTEKASPIVSADTDSGTSVKLLDKNVVNKLTDNTEVRTNKKFINQKFCFVFVG